jgi:hypothetical protein
MPAFSLMQGSLRLALALIELQLQSDFGEMVKLLATVRINSITISRPVSDAQSGETSHRRLGVALYQRVSMCNHSCYPNAVVSFHGREAVLCASRPIPSQTPVCISYGPIFVGAPRQSRIRSLRELYCFECACEACSGNLIVPVPRWQACDTTNCSGCLHENETCLVCGLNWKPSQSVAVRHLSIHHNPPLDHDLLPGCLDLFINPKILRRRPQRTRLNCTSRLAIQ